jgi:hypothetical protein
LKPTSYENLQGEKHKMGHEDHDKSHEPGPPHPHQHEHEVEEALEEALELDTQSQIFLEMRRQNLELLRIATEVAGYTGEHGPLKSGDIRSALRSIWDVFSEFYTWVDPEEDEDEDEDDDEEEEDDA